MSEGAKWKVLDEEIQRMDAPAVGTPVTAGACRTCGLVECPHMAAFKEELRRSLAAAEGAFEEHRQLNPLRVYRSRGRRRTFVSRLTSLLRIRGGSRPRGGL